MAEFDYRLPPRLIFGRGRFDELGAAVQPHGARALLVTGRRSARASGLIDRALASLRSAGVDAILFEEVIPNPTVQNVLDGASHARQEGCDVVIGLGGGSAMDAAKAIAVAATHSDPFWEFVIAPRGSEKREPTAETLPLVCVPTTAGTASELTPFAVISNPATREKAALFSQRIFARVALSDPELTHSVPPDVTAATGLDVFAHAVESFISNVATPITDAVNREAMRRVGSFLRRAVKDGSDAEAREQMLLANTFAGMALSNTGATIMHALEHPISALFPEVAHGAGLAVQMSTYIRFVTPAAPDKVAEVARLLGEDVDGLSVDEACQRAHDAIDRLVADVGITGGLRELGVTEDAFGQVADDALRYMAGALGKCPRQASRDDLIEFLGDCM
jgi:alcohol dehydrogenase